MAIVNIGDLLDRAQDYEARLEDYYSEIRDKSKNNGVRLLAYYFSRHSHHLKQAVEDLKPDLLEHISKVKLKYDVNFNTETVFKIMDTPPEEAKAENLLNAAVQYNTALIDLYNKILQQPLIAEVKSFIESIIKVEERDVVMIKKMLAMNYF
jgi:Skp family chaperone for outer membrane proteins